MAQPIEFFFDFSSPYGYIGSRLIDDLATRHGRTVVWKPILLGAIFKTTGMAPLVDIPLKGDYVKRDFPRTAAFHGVTDFRLPDPFPFPSIAAVRAFYWLERTDPARARDLARALFTASFCEGRDIAPAEMVAEVAQGIGIGKDALLTAIATPEVKDKVRVENDVAMTKGVFGSPYLIIDEEPFWGVDRFDQAEKWLKTGGW